MALDVPGGDERTYDDLVADARKRIPALAAAWTDHNASDPGITILETLAWLTETYRYQFDRVDERHLHAYLRLVGEAPTPPLPATVRLALTLPPERDDTELPVGTTVKADAGTLEERSFSTTGPVALTGARLARVVSVHDGRSVDQTTANDVDGLHYQPFGSRGGAESAVYLGFAGDPFATNDHLDLWVAFHETGLVRPAPDPTERPTDRYTWLWSDESPTTGTNEAGDDQTGGTESAGSAGAWATRRREATRYRPSVSAVWEFCADYDRTWTDEGWQPFAAVEDHTTDLYHGGRVRLSLTSDDGTVRPQWPTDAGSVRDVDGQYYWVRCTLRPRARDPAAAWSREPCSTPPSTATSTGRRTDAGSGRPPAHDIPPQFEAVQLNVVEAAHLTLVEEPTRLVRTDGRGESDLTTARPDQTFAFASHSVPVLAADVVTYPPPTLDDRADDGPTDDGPTNDADDGTTDDADDGPTDDAGPADPEPESPERREWTVVTHFDASTPDDAHVRLTPEAGTVTFGDGIRGRPPRPGQYVEARRSLVGGGTEGNVPRSSTWRYLLPGDGGETDTLVPATALTDAAGGTPAESPAAALDRVRRARAEPTRAVTLEDYRTLALETPGLRVGRVAAMPGSSDPPTGCVGSNEVRVVVVPFSTRERPEPSAGFLRAVRCHLRRHALVTDRVVVEAPTYVGVGVTVEVGLAPDAVEATVRDAVASELDAFLAPLAGRTAGWPFGRPLYPSEVYEVVESVAGVDCVLDVGFDVEGPGRLTDAAVELPETGLFYPLDHDVRVRRDADACRGDRR